jgi:site-specific DNA-cytosine methylase
LTSSLNQCQFLKKFSLLYNSIHLINEFKLINIIFGLKNFNWPKSVEKKEYEINTFIENNPDFFIKYKNKIDLVVGGPPCQGFSSAGKRVHDDPRNELYKSYIKFIRKINPKIIAKYVKNGDLYSIPEFNI